MRVFIVFLTVPITIIFLLFPVNAEQIILRSSSLESENKCNNVSGSSRDLAQVELKPRDEFLHNLDSIKTRKSGCTTFSKNAIIHNEWQLKNNCGYDGPEWNSNFQYHYNRCEKNQVFSNEFRKRQESIAKCICTPYANSAVLQNKDNQLSGCGLTDNRWSSDFTYHYNWCARGGGDIIETGNFDKFKLDRDNALANCKKPLTPTNLRVTPKLTQGTIRKPTLSWNDPGAGKAQTAERFKLEVFVNEDKVGMPLVPGQSYTFSAGILPYSALVNWRVKGLNKFGESSFSDKGSFRVMNNPSSSPSKKKPQEKSTGRLNGGYVFDTVGWKAFDVTVTFKGKVISASSSTGKDTFTLTKKQRVSPGGPANVNFSVTGLKRGTWTVTAIPQTVGGPITCKASVPGMVRLSVAGGQGPSCSSF